MRALDSEAQPPPQHRCHRAQRLPTALNANEEFYRIPDQSGSFSNPGQLLGARKQIIIECHSGSHSYLHIQDSIVSVII